MRRFTVLLGLFYFFNCLNAEEVTLGIEVYPEFYTFYTQDGRSLAMPSIEGASYLEENDFIPHIKYRIPIRFGSDPVIQILDVNYQKVEIDRASIGGLNSSDIQLVQKTTIDRKIIHKSLEFTPVRVNPSTGDFEVATEIRLDIRPSAVQQINQRSGPSSLSKSILDKGNWYKIGVTTDGVYRIDYSFLQNIGAGNSNISIQQLGVFGHHGGMLPEKNDIDRTDDLAELSIQISDNNSNGIFDQGDFLQFYGQSPHTVYYDASESRYRHQWNVYTDTTFYFISTTEGSGKQLGSVGIDNGANVNVTTFDDFQFHHVDRYSLIKSGRQWLGEPFSTFNAIQTYDFSFPNLVSSSQAKLYTRVAARSTTANSTINVKVSGQQLQTHLISTVPTSYTAIYARFTNELGPFNPPGDNFNVQLEFSNMDNNAEAWLDFIEIQAERQLRYAGQPLTFRKQDIIGAGNVAAYTLTNAPSQFRLWDITDPLEVNRQNYSQNGNQISFSRDASMERSFIMFSDQSSRTPLALGTIENQNLHANGMNGFHPDLLIIAPDALFNQATELAEFHRNEQSLTVSVVQLDQIYNEFAAGKPDITAIRDFVKMVYDRAGTDQDKLPQFLTIFGDGTYDFKQKVSNHNYLVPSYQSEESVSPTVTYVTDDYFGFLDDGEGDQIASKDQDLDIAIGRISVSNENQAQAIIQKIKHYAGSSSFGGWRNDVVFVADDEDNNTHINDADKVANVIYDNYPDYNLDKIYMDAYPQLNTPGGDRYPDVNEAIKARMFKGALLLSYVGHGGVSNLAHERIFNIPEIQGFDNLDNMPVFVTATCEFSRFDDPERTSAGEFLFLNQNGGALAMVTTVRIVYSNQNYEMNNAFFNTVFERNNGNWMALGEVMRRTKNEVLTSSNNRKFALLGDPALPLAYPLDSVITTKINGQDIATLQDTIKALSEMTVNGEVLDHQGNIRSDFNGVIFPTIFDKEKNLETLSNDPGSPKRTFKEQSSIIYKGKATVKDGRFTFNFIVPKDINYRVGNGKISYYATNNNQDAQGHTYSFKIGSTASDVVDDREGPIINLFMNDENFAYGGTTNSDPILLAKLEDQSGINTTGNGIGHDITAILDDDARNQFILNDFYEAELDNFRKGVVRYPFKDLDEGPHTLTLKAWDTYNNSSEATLEFLVESSAELALNHVLNYPNPFTTRTEFHFEHNRPGQLLDVLVQIYSVSGRLVKSIYQPIVSDGYRVSEIEWNGIDDFGDRVANGAYLYKLQVKTPDGKTATKFEKLVILK